MNIIIKKIQAELKSAKEKYPEWPPDIIHQVAIMNEESGESIRAALNYSYHNEPLELLEKELIQTAAMCIRIIENMQDKNGYPPEEQPQLFE